MQALFPPSPYILTNRHIFLYIEAECPKYNNEWFLCEKRNYHLRTSSDCIQNLIQNQTINHHTCEMTTINLSQEAMEALEERHYILPFPCLTHLQKGRFHHVQWQLSSHCPCWLHSTSRKLFNKRR